MFQRTLFQWPLQPSTVIGLGILAGSGCYLLTGDPLWASLAAAGVKILVPDNSGAQDRVFGAIKILAQAVGRPLPTTSQSAPVVSSDRGSGAAALGKERPKE